MKHASRKIIGPLHHELVIQHCQRLQDDRGAFAARAMIPHVGLIEHTQDRWKPAAPRQQIDAPPPAAAGGRLVVAGNADAAVRLRLSIDRRPTDLTVHSPTAGQHGIPNDLGRQPPHRHPGERRIRHGGRVAIAARRCVCRSLPVDCRTHQPSQQRFQTPAGVDPFRRERLEQVRVRRSGALVAKVIRAAHQPDAEQMLPGAVDLHTGHQCGGSSFAVCEPAR